MYNKHGFDELDKHLLLERSLNAVQQAKYNTERVAALDEYHAVVDAAYDEYRLMPTADALAKYQLARNAAQDKYKSIRDALLIRILRGG